MRENQDNNSDKFPAIFIMGPTATGKTALAMELVEKIAGEIISVDSAMIYRGMDIGTGKPTSTEIANIPHHLIDIRDPGATYSAAEFCQDAFTSMREITQRGKIPILVGGTLLYFRALEQGLSQLPSADLATRAEILKQANLFGWQAMHQRLAEIDPLVASKIHPNDPQRIQRALEVYEITKQPMSSFWHMNSDNPPMNSHNTPMNDRDETFPLSVSKTHLPAEIKKYRLHKFVILPRDRAELHRRIEIRFHQMLKAGLLTEVETLYRRADLHLNLPSMRAVGYRQIWQYFDECIHPSHHDKHDPESLLFQLMIQKSIAATRQLAKRQLTWLRNSSLTIPSNGLNSIHYLEMENSYLDSLRTMVHCCVVNQV